MPELTRRWSLTTKLAATGLTFLVLALASIGLTLWVSWNLEGGAAAVNEAGRLRMMTYRLALGLPEAGAADEASRAQARSFEGSLQLLDSGDPSRPLFVPWSSASRERFAAIRLQWGQLKRRWLDGVQPRAQTLADADRFVEQVDLFVGEIEQSLAGWTAVLHAFQLAMMGLAIGSAVALLYAGYLLVLQPVSQLRRGLASLQSGDLSTRIRVASDDEFGQLSAGFNEMAETLQSLYGSLEERVREKTARLEEERRRLAALYEVSAFVAGATQLEDLAEGFARRVRRIAGADASAVRWSGDGRPRYLLLASDNLPEAMREAEHCLDAGRCGCGQLPAQAATRVIPLAGPPEAMPLCRRQGFASLFTVPVRSHDKVLGEVDLFFRTPVELSPDDRELLDALARHLASAMEGLKAAALEREAAVAEERGMLARELHDSIAQSLAFLKIQVQLLREASRRGNTEAAERALGELDTGVRECYADVRELLVHFRTRTSTEDIEPALAATVSKFTHQSGIEARLQVDSLGVALPPDVQTQVLHIVQEALSNARKHAGASQVVVRVSGHPHWRFEVRDDGRGFDPASAGGGGTHVGLRIMQERAERIGAQVRVDTGAGRGCSVVLELAPPRPAGQPLAEAAA